MSDFGQPSGYGAAVEAPPQPTYSTLGVPTFEPATVQQLPITNPLTGQPFQRRRRGRMPAPARFVEPNSGSAPVWQQALDLVLRPAKWALDIISRPGYAVQGAIYNAYRAQGDELQAAFRGFWNGLLGNERRQFVDTLKLAGMPRGWLRSLVGFAGDIALDPVMWVPGVGGVKIASLTKQGKLLQQATQLTLEGGQVARTLMVGSKAAQVARATGQTIAPLAATWGAQAAQGARPLLSFFGRGVLRAAPVVGALGKAGQAVQAAPVVRNLLQAFSTPAKLRNLGMSPEAAHVAHRMLRLGAHKEQWLEYVGMQLAEAAAQRAEKAVGFKLPHLVRTELLEDALETGLGEGVGKALGARALERVREIAATAPGRAGKLTPEQLLRGTDALRAEIQPLLAAGGARAKETGLLRYLWGEYPAMKAAQSRVREAALAGRKAALEKRYGMQWGTSLGRIEEVTGALNDAALKAKTGAQALAPLSAGARAGVAASERAALASQSEAAATIHHYLWNIMGQKDRGLLLKMEVESLGKRGVPMSLARDMSYRLGMDDLTAAIDERLARGLPEDRWAMGLKLGQAPTVAAERGFYGALVDASHAKPLDAAIATYGKSAAESLATAQARAADVIAGLAGAPGGIISESLRGIRGTRLKPQITQAIAESAGRTSTVIKRIELRLEKARGATKMWAAEAAAAAKVGYVPRYDYERGLGDVLKQVKRYRDVAGEGGLATDLRALHERLIHESAYVMRTNDELAARLLLSHTPIEDAVRTIRGAGGARQLGTTVERTGKYLGDIERAIVNRRTIEDLARGTSRGMFKNMEDAAGQLAVRGMEDFDVLALPWKREFHIVPRGIKEEFTRLIFPTNDDVRGLLKAHDMVLSAWKQVTLFTPPHVLAYTARNAGADAMNAWASDAFNPKYWGLAYRDTIGRFAGRAANPDMLVDLGANAFIGSTYEVAGKTYKLAQNMRLGDLHELAAAGGLFGKGYAQSLMAGPGIARLRPMSELPGLVRRAFQVGKAKLIGIPASVDDGSRLGAFMTRLSRGDSIESAIFNVHKALYDYGDLTRFERTVMKRLYPFFIWTRRNLPAQIARHAAAPGRILVYRKLKDNIEDALGERKVERDLLPQWVKDRFGIQVGGSKDYPVFLVLGGFVPMLDLMDVRDFGAMKRMVENSLGPMPKELVQQWLNYDAFWRQDLERFRGETEKFLGMPMPRRFTHLLRNVRLLTWIDRYMKRTPTGAIPQMLGAEPIAQATVGLAPYRASREKWVQSKYYEALRMRDMYRISARAAEREGRPEVAAQRMAQADAMVAEMRRLEAMAPGAKFGARARKSPRRPGSPGR